MAETEPRATFVARPPRFGATTDNNLSVRVTRLDRKAGSAFPVELVNLSRYGIQIAGGEAISIAERLQIELRDSDLGVKLTLTGTVAWRNETNDGWLVGCELDDEMPWEVLGELFLGAVLSPQGA